MKKVLVYYPFTLAEQANSGSKLRPHEMYKAFCEWGSRNGVNILFISGTSAEREKQFRQLVNSGELEDIWFCYMENQTIPLWLTDPGHKPKKPFIDWTILRYLKKRNVPVGVFYRDVYWKFDELYPLKGWKKKVMQTIYRLEERFYEAYCDVIFLPSNEMGKYVAINRPMTDLPPGGKQRAIERETRNDSVASAVYVGGINNEDYGLFLLLDALELVNEPTPLLHLTIVCRKNEYEALPEEQKARIHRLGVDVRHISGAELDRLYEQMDFAFIPRLRSEYNDFSVPVKLVEYLSNELPVVATNCLAQQRFIETDEYGVICEDTPLSMAEAIRTMIERSEYYRQRISETFMQKHSWLARVEKVKQTLTREDT
ncbi:glycosyltransferase involved in cell wall biosynthesis [Anoxybacillus voinovskiensis]|uniref:Glycosyltransferase involved in cell wall biosynthesis n=1 Tax=Anoxybacteroides voinovskiense TaxID=230470 RepID=A0A840DKH2_9BACL|nr:glycosyltransferase [Anoxybacillus voinovskiensis]MBB4073781.1 glycosyltransferase involved in cell wall biosynthesis [Anoxybacillus voinovskiensis]GGJ63943.1 glycosyl transferase [Anoxybacillus voinovskiensis]